MNIRNNRVAVTVQQWHDRPDQLLDNCAYMYSEGADQLGFDPWRTVDSIDKHSRLDKYYLWVSNTTTVIARPTDELYISVRDYNILMQYKQ